MITKRWLFISTILLSIGHIAGAFLGKVSFPQVLICPLLFLFTHFVMHVGFGYCIKNNDFTMISGYNKKTDSDDMVIAILNSVELYTAIMAVFCNILFCSIYFIEAKMVLCLSLFGIFVSSIIIIAVVSKYKYSRNYP